MVLKIISYLFSFARKIVSYRAGKEFFTIFFFLIFSSFLLFYSNLAFAQAEPEQSIAIHKQEEKRISLTPEEKSWLKEHPNIVLAYTDTFEPEVIVNPDGSHSGILVDFLDEMNRRLGTRITLRIDSIPGILEKAKTKEVDGILEMHPEYADKLGLLKSMGYLRAYPSVFARKDVSFAGPDDFAGKKIVIIDKVYFTEKMVREYGEQSTILRVKDAIQGMKSVSDGDADLYIGVSFNSYYITKYQLFDVVIKYIFRDFPDKFGMAVRPDWPELVPILNKGIASFSQNEIDTIVSKWIHLPQQEKTVELTSEEKTWLSEHPDIRFAFSADYPPGLIVDEDGDLSGQFKDVIDLLNQRLGSNFGITVAEIKAVREMVANKEVAGQLALTAGNGASRGLLETHVLWETYPVIYGPRNFPMKINTLEDLKGKAVSTLKGSRYAEKILASYQEKIDIVRTDTIVEAFRLVYEGKVDYMIGLTTQAYYLTKMRFLTLEPAFVMTDRPTKIVMGVRDDWPKLVEILNKGLKSITEDEWVTINDKWLGTPDVISPQLSLTLEEQAWLDQNHTVQVRVVNIPPYIILRKDAVPIGVSIDYLKLIGERTGVKFEYIASGKTFAEALDGLKRLQGPDLITSMMRTPEREKSILFSNDYVRSPYVIFTHTDDKEFITDIADLHGKKIAVPRGTVIHKRIKSEYPDLNLVLFENDIQSIEAVATGKADTYIGNLTLASFLILEKGLPNIKIAGPSPFGDHVFSMAIRNDWPELASIVDKGLAAISPEDQAEIRNKYISIEYEHTETAVIIKWFLIIGGAASGIVFLFVFWNKSLRNQVQARTVDLEILNQDLTEQVEERQKAEKSLMELEAEERALIDAVKGPFFLMNVDGTIIVANQGIADLFGKRVSELSGTKAFDLIPEGSSKKRRLGYVEKVIVSGQARIFIDEGLADFGNTDYSRLKTVMGRSKKLAVFATDITEDVIARRMVEESEERFRATFEQAAVGIAHVSPEGSFLRINRKFCDIVGYSHDEMVDLTFQDITHPDDLEKDLEFVRKLLDGKEDSYSMEKRYLHKGGQAVWINLTVSLLRDDKGKPNYFVGVIEVISKRKLTEEALRDSEEKFRYLVEQSPLSIQIFNLDGQIIRVNKAWQELWRVSEEDLSEVLEKYNVLEDEEARKLGLTPHIEKAFKGEVVTLPVIEYDASSTMDNIEINHVKANKNWIQARLYPIRNSKGEVVNVVDIEENITASKQAEEKILYHQQRLKALASQLIIAEEKERSRIAADLHDHIGQTLAFLRIQVAKAKKYASEEKLANILDEISQSLLKTIQDTKDLVFDLSSPLLNELGLHAAILHWLEENVSKKHGIEFELVGKKVIFSLSKDVRSILFRNVRELLANVIRHAQASKVIVSLVDNVTEAKIIVYDDGIGFDMHELKEKEDSMKKFGLFSIRERMEDMGGSLEMVSEPGKGCKAILSIPLDTDG